MELQPVNPTAEAPAQRFTGDVYLTPIHAGTGASRMSVTLVRTRDGTDPTTWLEPFPDDDYAAADQRRRRLSRPSSRPAASRGCAPPRCG